MKEFNKNGVFCLTANTPEGYVKVLRVGDVDYIWTFGTAAGHIYIILIPDLIVGYQIPVSINQNDYTFDVTEMLDKDIVRYEYPRDYEGQTGANNRRQYMPYIVKQDGTSYASVGNPAGGLGQELFLDPINDWHYKHYILDCTGDQDPTKEKLWRPPSQYTAYGFGEDLIPVWYSMSRATAHSFHFCFEAAIDQSKRIYQPINIDVTLANAEIIIPAFTLAGQTGKRYNFLYPTTANRFYGKNAFDYIKDPETGEILITAFGESIYMSGVVTPTVPSGINPILFFWPWIPYLDDIRAFNVLTYLWAAPEGGGTQAWYMKPILETLKKWSIGYYAPEGVYQTIPLSEDSAIFSDVLHSSSSDSSDTPNPCACGDCGTGVWNSQTVTTVPPYNASGIRHIHIGLIGGKIPITMKTEWNQSGSGPVDTVTQQWTVTGSYPWDSLHDGSMNGLDYWYESCCITSFINTSHRNGTSLSSASNRLTLNQTLKVGDDIIFSGESSMDYDMAYSGQETYDGSITGTVVPEGLPSPPECSGVINYTLLQMSIGQTQNLSWTDNTSYPAPFPCSESIYPYVFSWSLSGGGSISSTTDQNIVYTAPTTNPDCGYNATISLICNGVVIDAIEITVNAYANLTTEAYYQTELDGVFSNCIWTNYGCRKLWWYKKTSYNCLGEVLAETRSPCVGDSCPSGCGGSTGALLCTTRHVGEGLIDVRTEAMKAAGCCPAPLM
jgi:hypothetical protein